MARKTDRAQKSIETVTHKFQRTNFPTEELRGFVTEEENSPLPTEPFARSPACLERKG